MACHATLRRIKYGRREEVCVCLCWVEGWGVCVCVCVEACQKVEIKTVEGSHLCIQSSGQKAALMVIIDTALPSFSFYLSIVAIFPSLAKLALILLNSCHISVRESLSVLLAPSVGIWLV